MKYLLEHCMNITQTQYAYLYCFIENSYSLLKSIHLNDDYENELICLRFDFEKDEIFSGLNTKNVFSSTNFIIREILVSPIFSDNNKKLGLLVLGTGVSDNELSPRMTEKMKMIRRRSTPILIDMSSEKFEPLKSIRQMLITFLEAEKYKYLYENKISLGSSEFSRDLLLINMSHEIRTPLNGIIGYTQLLFKTKLNDVQYKYLSSMNHCCFQLMQIVNDVLDYARLSTSKAELHEECFPLKDLEEASISILGTQIKSKKQVLTFDISEDASEFIYADKPKIIQVLVNLLSNAHKFSMEGKEIKVKIRESGDEIILFEIEDQGVGISEEDQTKLFHVFTQLENNMIKVGTGLGLAISKKLVELLKGIMWIKSKTGMGSTFYFTVKFQKCENMEKRIQDNIPLIKGKYILLVDDNATNRMLTSDLIFEWEMVPIPCASGIEAVRLIMNKRYRFSLALIDICMPEMNGVDLAKLIREEQPYLPMIAMSSADSFDHHEYFDGRINKPIHREKLFNHVIKILGSETSREYMLFDREDTKLNLQSLDFKILIAEDIGYSLALLVNILNSLEYKKVETSYDGKDAITKIDEVAKTNEPFDILFLDLKMPRLDGYGVIKHIREKGYKIDIIVITASVLEEEKNKCKNEGIKYFIPKPIEIKKLRDVLSIIAQQRN